MIQAIAVSAVASSASSSSGMHAVVKAGGEEDVAHVIGGEPAQFGQPLLLRDA